MNVLFYSFSSYKKMLSIIPLLVGLICLGSVDARGAGAAANGTKAQNETGGQELQSLKNTAKDGDKNGGDGKGVIVNEQNGSQGQGQPNNSQNNGGNTTIPSVNDPKKWVSMNDDDLTKARAEYKNIDIFNEEENVAFERILCYLDGLLDSKLPIDNTHQDLVKKLAESGELKKLVDQIKKDPKKIASFKDDELKPLSNALGNKDDVKKTKSDLEKLAMESITRYELAAQKPAELDYSGVFKAAKHITDQDKEKQTWYEKYPKSGNGKTYAIIGGVVVIFAILGLVGYYFYSKKGAEVESALLAEDEESHEESENEEKETK